MNLKMFRKIYISDSEKLNVWQNVALELVA